jgi:hypothetical protein
MAFAGAEACLSRPALLVLQLLQLLRELLGSGLIEAALGGVYSAAGAAPEHAAADGPAKLALLALVAPGQLGLRPADGACCGGLLCLRMWCRI